MPKTPDEKIEHLERKLNMYRALVMLMFVLLMVIQRERIHVWIDHMEGWFNAVSSAKAT